jgi:DNA-binding transcriptional ArsR family regulator
MSSTLKSLRALSDPTRLRIVALLEKDELSVNELQEITRMGQSRISTHLGLLQDAELVQSRREGKRTFYSRNQSADAAATECMKLATRGARELAEHAADQVNLKRILARRNDSNSCISTRSRAVLIAVMGLGVRGKPLARCCYGSCHLWSWRIWAPGKDC